MDDINSLTFRRCRDRCDRRVGKACSSCRGPNNGDIADGVPEIAFARPSAGAFSGASKMAGSHLVRSMSIR